MEEQSIWRKCSNSIAVQYHASETMDVQEEFDAVAILVEDSLDDGGLRFGEGRSAVEGVAAGQVARAFTPEDVEVSVEVYSSAEDGVGATILAPETELKRMFGRRLVLRLTVCLRV